jgi:endonuclease/exonuclease/phosphatase (EEP) superfamily protein YafD
MPRYKKPLFSRHLVRLVAFIVLLIVLSLLAPIGWPFELLSHFVVQYAFVLALLGVWLLLVKRSRWALFTFIVCATQIYQLIPFWKPMMEMSEPSRIKEEEVRVLQFNVNHNNDNVNDMTHWIVSHSEDIDIVVLLEVTDKWQMAIERIKWSYPYHISKEARGDRQIIVLSRLLIDELEVQQFAQNIYGIVLRGATMNGDAPFVLYSVHPAPPIFPSAAKKRNEVLFKAAEKIAQEKADYKILIGDFNMTPFSPYFKQLEKKSGLYDSNKGIGILGTWPSFAPKGLGISIDNMLISEGIKVENKQLGPAMGSDHYPVITTLKFMIPETGE